MLAVLFYVALELFLGNDSANGAAVGASAAIQAGSSVDHVLIVTLRDSAGGAGIRASTAAHASRSNLVCHLEAPPLKL